MLRNFPLRPPPSKRYLPEKALQSSCSCFASTCAPPFVRPVDITQFDGHILITPKEEREENGAVSQEARIKEEREREAEAAERD